MAARSPRLVTPTRTLIALLVATIGAVFSLPLPATAAPPARTAYSLRLSPRLAPAERRLIAELNRPVNWDLRDQTLDELVDWLRREGLPARIDSQELEAAGIERNLKFIQGRSVNLPLATALRSLLTPHGAGFALIESNGRLELLITSRDDADSRFITRLYPVSDLVDARGRGRYAADYTRLVERLQRTSGGDEPGWVDDGGAGLIEVHVATRSLAISTTFDVHVEIERVLAQLRRGAGRQRDSTRHDSTQRRSSLDRLAASSGDSSSSSASPVSYSLLASPRERRREQELDRKLEQPVTWNLRAKPIDDWVRSLARDYDLPIRLDERSLEGSGIGRQAKLTAQVTELPLGQALDRVLAELQLGVYRESASQLVVAERFECEQRLETRIYPVRDLVRSVERGQTKLDYKPLSELIQNTAGKPEPGWIDDGGVGVVEVEGGSRSLVISTTGEVHRQIAALLMTLREVRRDSR